VEEQEESCNEEDAATSICGKENTTLISESAPDGNKELRNDCVIRDSDGDLEMRYLQTELES